MKYYDVPIYQGNTTIKKLEPCGNAVVSRDILGRVFLASDSTPVDVISSCELEMISKNLYLSDKDTFRNYKFHKFIETFGSYYCCLQEDLLKKNQVVSFVPLVSSVQKRIKK